MKIHADKIEAPPQHTLTVRDVKRILAAVPATWLEGLEEVRLSNSLELAPVAFSSGHHALTIRSRGHSVESTVTAIFSDLAANFLGLATHYGYRLSAADARRVRHLIAPLVEEMVAAITPAKPPAGYHPSRAFHPVALTGEDKSR